MSTLSSSSQFDLTLLLMTLPSQGKLKDEVHDQAFEDGDAAQLFLASSLETNTTNGEALADDAKRKEEIKTASANPATHLTSEEEGIEGIDGRRGLLHCGSSDLDTSVQTESEGGILLEKCDKEALDLVEGALLRMLSGKSAVPLRENLPVKASGDWKTSEVEEREQIRRLRNSEGSVSSGAEEDMQLLAKLLEEVCLSMHTQGDCPLDPCLLDDNYDSFFLLKATFTFTDTDRDFVFVLYTGCNSGISILLISRK